VARTPSPILTEAELRLMEVLWRRERGTTREVVEALPERDARAYSTVRTTLAILERKGYLRHRKRGRAFVYEPRVDRDEARRRAVRHLLARYFDDSPALLLLNLLEAGQLEPGELDRLKAMAQETEPIEP
jgi:predicted transcriptional regulator